jgi:hypothetical protein
MSDTEQDTFDYDLLRELVTKVIKPVGSMSARALSLAASGQRNPDLIRNFLNNGTKPNIESIVGICEALNTPFVLMLKDWTGPIPRGRSWLTIDAAVEAGVWRERVIWDEDEWYDAFVEKSEGQIYLSGVVVRGRSMDKVLPVGTILRCTDFNGIDPEFAAPGYVIVSRKNGDIRELTCRKLVQGRFGRWELRYESYVDAFDSVLELTEPFDNMGRDGFTDQEGKSVRIVATVDDAFLPLRPFRTRPTVKRGSLPVIYD